MSMTDTVLGGWLWVPFSQEPRRGTGRMAETATVLDQSLSVFLVRVR
jgi:hypothetical protein